MPGLTRRGQRAASRVGSGVQTHVIRFEHQVFLRSQPSCWPLVGIFLSCIFKKRFIFVIFNFAWMCVLTCGNAYVCEVCMKARGI